MLTMQPETLYDYARIALAMDPTEVCTLHMTDAEKKAHTKRGAYTRSPNTAWFELHIHEYSAHEMAVKLNLSVNYVRRKAKRLGLEFTNCNY